MKLLPLPQMLPQGSRPQLLQFQPGRPTTNLATGIHNVLARYLGGREALAKRGMFPRGILSNPLGNVQGNLEEFIQNRRR